MGMYARGREEPTVLSTRILRTLRANELNWTRLTDRLQNIEREKTLRYLEHCHEIIQEKKRLIDLLAVKKNTEISVERRKLLITKGYTIFHSSKDNTLHVRRTRPSSALPFSKSQDETEPSLINKDLLGDMHDLNVQEVFEDDIGEGNFERKSQQKVRSYHFRTITPPLKTGSRQFFRDVSSTVKSRKDQTSYREASKAKKNKETKRVQSSIKTPKNISESGTDLEEDETDTDLQDFEVEDAAESTENMSDNPENEFPIKVEITSFPRESGEHSADDLFIVKEEEKGRFVDQKETPEIGQQPQTDCARPATCVGQRKVGFSTDEEEKQVDKIQHAPISKTKGISDKRPFVRPFSAVAKIEAEGVLFDLEKNTGTSDEKEFQTKRGYDPMVSKVNHNHSKLPAKTDSKDDAGISKASRQKFQASKSPNARMIHENVVYDARPNRSLSRGYSTMQMTLGSRQVKVHVPKFTHSSDELMIEVSRAKATFRAADKQLNNIINPPKTEVH